MNLRTVTSILGMIAVGISLTALVFVLIVSALLVGIVFSLDGRQLECVQYPTHTECKLVRKEKT